MSVYAITVHRDLNSQWMLNPLVVECTGKDDRRTCVTIFTEYRGITSNYSAIYQGIGSFPIAPMSDWP